MQIPFRLYYPSDVDLIALKLRFGRRFNKMIRSSIAAFIRGDDAAHPIVIPDNIADFVRAPEEPIAMTLTFHEKREADVIAYLSGIREYARNDVIRTIVRFSYDEFPSWMFLFGDAEKMEMAKRKSRKMTSIPKRGAGKKKAAAEKVQAAAEKEKAPSPDVTGVTDGQDATAPAAKPYAPKEVKAANTGSPAPVSDTGTIPEAPKAAPEPEKPGHKPEPAPAAAPAPDTANSPSAGALPVDAPEGGSGMSDNVFDLLSKMDES